MRDLTSISNLKGTYYFLNQRVIHSEGWKGTIIRITEHGGMIKLFVNPDSMADLRDSDYWQLNPMYQETDKPLRYYVAPRDRGASMGNYMPINLTKRGHKN